MLVGLILDAEFSLWLGTMEVLGKTRELDLVNGGTFKDLPSDETWQETEGEE